MTNYRQNYGIGLVGLGIGQQHLRGYRCQDLNVAAICDLDQNLLAATAEEFGIQKTYTQITDLIADPEIRIIDLAIQPWLRLPVVRAAARAGKHLLCQKPFSMNMRQAVEMVEVCEANEVELMVNQNSCFVPGFVAIEPYLNSQHLGEIYHASITCDGWFLDFPEQHVIPAMMVHHVGLIYKWFGTFENVYCQAHGHKRSLDQGEVMAVAQLKTTSGVQVLLSCNWGFLGASGHTHCHSYEEIRIQGTKGAICGHSNDLSVHLTEPEEQEIKPEIDGDWFPHAFGNVMVHLIDSLEKGEKPITDGRRNLHVVQTLFAMFESAKNGRLVAINEIALDEDYDLSPAPVLGL